MGISLINITRDRTEQIYLSESNTSCLLTFLSMIALAQGLSIQAKWSPGYMVRKISKNISLSHHAHPLSEFDLG